MKIGLFYGSTTCYTEMAAEKIRAPHRPRAGRSPQHQGCALARMQEYDILILGISTWDFGELQEGLGISLGRHRRPASGGTHHRPVWHGRSAGLWGVVSGCPRPAARSAGPQGVKLVGYWPNVRAGGTSLTPPRRSSTMAVTSSGWPSMTPTSTTSIEAVGRPRSRTALIDRLDVRRRRPMDDQTDRAVDQIRDPRTALILDPRTAWMFRRRRPMDDQTDPHRAVGQILSEIHELL